MQFTPENLPPSEFTDRSSGPDRMFLFQLGAAVVVVLVAVGMVLAMTIGSGPERSAAPVADAPSSQPGMSTATTGLTSNANVEESPAALEAASASAPTNPPNDSWRSEVVVHETAEVAPTSDGSEAVEEPVVRELVPMPWIDEPTSQTDPAPAAPPSASEPMQSPTPPSEPASLPTIPERTYRDCGTLVVPDGAGLFLFALSASSEPVIVCLGESIGASCGDHSAVIQTPDLGEFAAVVTEKPDGTCAVGARLTTDTLSLCSVERLMDIGVGPDQTESQWRTAFRADPGGTFVDMYLENRSVFQEPSAGGEYECETYREESS